MNPDIIAALDDDHLSESQAAALITALRDDPDRRRDMAREWRVHRTLPILADTQAGARLSASLHLARPMRPTGRFVHRVRRRIRGSRRRWSPWLTAAAAAVVAATICLPLALPDQALAVVISSTGGTIAGHAARPGERIAAEVELIGPMMIAWNGEATQVELAAEAALHLSAGSDGKRLVLARGAVTAAVAPQPASAPLIVTAPLGRATVLGTRFTLTSRPERLLLSVANGRVRLSDNSGQAVDVPAGAAAAIDAGSAPSMVSGPDTGGRRLFRSEFLNGEDGWKSALSTAITEEWTNADECRWGRVERVPDPRDPQARILRLASNMPAQWFARVVQQRVRHPGIRMRLKVVGPLAGRRFFVAISTADARRYPVALDIPTTDTWLTVTVDWRDSPLPFRPGVIESLYVGEELAVGDPRTTRTLHLGDVELLELDDAARP